MPLDRDSRREPRFMAFDLLWCDGEDLCYLPLTERKRRPRVTESTWAISYNVGASTQSSCDEDAASPIPEILSLKGFNAGIHSFSA